MKTDDPVSVMEPLGESGEAGRIVRSPAFLIRLTVLFLALALVIALVVRAVYMREVGKEMDRLRSLEVLGTTMGSDALSYGLDTISKDLRFLASNSALKRALEAPAPDDLAHLSRDFADFLVAMGEFDKMRWIDESGREKVRVNYTAGRAIIVSRQGLQDKADRYYFEKTSKLNKDEIYISPFDLNVEHGEIETPYKPVIRFSMPVFDLAGKRRGIVVLSYLGQHVLDEFARASRGIGDHVMIVNQDGYWLKSPVSGDEWGFMLDRHKSFAERYPIIWQRIRSEDSSQFEEDGDLWTVRSVYPLRAGLLPGADQGQSVAPGQPHAAGDECVWKIVSHVPKGSIALVERQRIGKMVLIALLLSGVSFIACWKAASAWTRQKSSEEEEKRLAERLSLLLQNLGEGVFGVDTQGRCIFINPAALSMFGLASQETLGKDAHSLFHERRDCTSTNKAGECPILLTMNSGTPWQGEDSFVRSNGAAFPVLISATPLRRNDAVIGTVVVFQDISERKAVEEKLCQLHKMEAVRTLADGVAHEFNNILTAMMGHAHMLRMSMPEKDPMAEDVDKILSSGERGTIIVQRLLAITRNQSTVPTLIDLAELVSSLEPVMRRLTGGKIDIHIRRSGEKLIIRADRERLEQMLVNITANAADAMQNGGTLTITTGAASPEKGLLGQGDPGGNARYAFVAMADTGEGMDERTRQRAFDPFFTTKEPDKGTGLGLAVVYGIVRHLRGHVDVESRKGQGTTVTVYLPISGT